MFKFSLCFGRIFLLILFLLSPHFVFAWNSVCYSPVQMAALMSKPKKSGVSVSALKGQIRRLDKSIDAVYDKLDDEEARLADSLDPNKLKDDPDGVAREIRDYIESGQDGWDCDSSGQVFLFQAPPLFEILGYLLVPPAFGEKEGLDVPQTGEPAVPQPIQSAENQCKGYWYGNEQRCCPSEKPQLVNGLCVACPDDQRWDSNQCVNRCSEGERWDGSKCVSRCLNNMIWDNTQGRCVENSCEVGFQLENGRCVSEKKICESAGKYWNNGAKQCCPKDKRLVVNGQCKSLKENKCERSGGTWNDDSKQCKCPSDKPQLINGFCKACPADKRWDSERGKCISEKEVCEEEGKYWNNGAKQCCPKDKRLVVNGQCKSLKENKCERSGGTWNDDSKQCKCPSDKPQLINGSCKACPEDEKWDGNKCKSRCLNNMTWDGEQSRCVETSCKEGFQLENGKCVSEKEICKNEGKYWNAKAKQCCPKGKRLVVDGQCKSLKESKCEKSGGTWTDNQCKCPPGKPQLMNGRCIEKEDEDIILIVEPDAPEEDVAPTPVTEPEAPQEDETKCRQSGGDWKDGECKCPSSKPRLLDGKCDCPEWKKDKAFGNNGTVRKSFCDRYASNKRECAKALARIKKLANRIAKLESQKDKLEEELSNRTLANLNDSEKKTEAGGLCLDCLKRILTASRPSAGQQIGNVLTALTGAGLGIAGYQMGRRAQVDANMMRIQQGYEAQHDYYSLMGANAGYPYMAQGLLGMTRANTPVGGWSCSPTVSPYGHPYNYQYGQGYNMRYH